MTDKVPTGEIRDGKYLWKAKWLENLPINVCPFCWARGYGAEAYWSMCTRCGALFSGDTAKDFDDQRKMNRLCNEIAIKEGRDRYC